MTQLYPLDPILKHFLKSGTTTKIERLDLAAAEIFTDPIGLALRKDTDAASLIEISGVVTGDGVGGLVDLTLNFYRCPDGVVANRQVTPYATQVLDLSDVAAPGADLIVNGAFGADTDWTKGHGWTIAAGVADHFGLPSISALESAAALAVTDDAFYLLEMDATPLANTLKCFLGDQFIGDITVAASNTTLLFKADVGAATRRIKFLTTGTGVLDNIRLRKVTPYRFSAVKNAVTDDGAGSGFVMGILPADSLAGTYIEAKYRRLIA